jgi:hypothetical protein
MVEKIFINSFGLPCHDSDDLIHWDVPKKEKIDQANLLRPAFDAIIAAGLYDYLDTIIEAAKALGYENGRTDEESIHRHEDF